MNIGIKTYSVYRVKKSKIDNFNKTIIIPAKNEEGNLDTLIKRIPKIEKYQILIPCGVSQDNTYEVAKRISRKAFEIQTFM